jgi:GMP synthase-like glutamine amidotransferase
MECLMKKVAIFQHAEGEWIGSMSDWFADKDFQLQTYRLDLNELLPTLDQFDWLLLMGGPMSVYDEQYYPWLVAEKKLIKLAIDSGKTVLGTCLGGQLIASSMGADVHKNTQAEIGWYPIIKTNSCATWLPERLIPLSWHSDCFDLPNEAIPFASSNVTPNQGFKLGEKVWALQFHLEAHAGTAETFLALDSGKLPVGEYVQNQATLFTTEHFKQSRDAAHALLDQMNLPQA